LAYTDKRALVTEGRQPDTGEYMQALETAPFGSMEMVLAVMTVQDADDELQQVIADWQRLQGDMGGITPEDFDGRVKRKTEPPHHRRTVGRLCMCTRRPGGHIE
jgi:hypothetical protein